MEVREPDVNEFSVTIDDAIKIIERQAVELAMKELVIEALKREVSEARSKLAQKES